MGFEPTQLALVDPESTPLNHSGKVSWWKRLRLQNRWDVAYMYYINENVYLIAAEFLGNSFVHQDSLAERSKAVAQGAIPQGRGFEPHSCHFAIVNNTDEKHGKNTPGQDRTGDLQRVRLTS